MLLLFMHESFILTICIYIDKNEILCITSTFNDEYTEKRIKVEEYEIFIKTNNSTIIVSDYPLCNINNKKLILHKFSQVEITNMENCNSREILNILKNIKNKLIRKVSIKINKKFKKIINDSILGFLCQMETTCGRQKLINEIENYEKSIFEINQRQISVQKFIKNPETWPNFIKILSSIPNAIKLKDKYKAYYKNFSEKNIKKIFNIKRNSTKSLEAIKTSSISSKESIEISSVKDTKEEKENKNFFLENKLNRKESLSEYIKRQEKENIKNEKKKEKPGKGKHLTKPQKNNFDTSIKTVILFKYISEFLLNLDNLNELLTLVEMKEIKIPREILEQTFKVINPSYDPSISPIIGSNIVDFIKPGISEYLDFSRNLYHESIKKMYKKLAIFFKEDLLPHKDSDVGICLKKIKTLANGHYTSIKSYENLNLIRETKQFNLFTNLELRLLNYKLEELFSVIIEESAIIAANAIIKLEGITKILEMASETISDVDIYLGIANFTSNNIKNYIFPTLSYQTKIEDSLNVFIETPFPHSYFINLGKKLTFILGSNNSGKTFYVEQLLLIIITTYLGLPISAKGGEIYFFSSLYYINSIKDYEEIKNDINENSLIVIDEIALPTFNKQLSLLNKLLSKNTQIIYITHNSLIVESFKDSQVIYIDKNSIVESEPILQRNPLKLASDYLPDKIISKAKLYWELFNDDPLIRKN